MSFGNRTFDEIAAMLLTAFSAQGTDVTDLSEGSVVATMLESVAIVAQQVEEDLVARLDSDIASSAYRSFDFSLLPAQSATGALTAIRDSASQLAVTIPVGTAFLIPGTTLRFLSQVQVILPANQQTVDIPVIAETPGTISNVPAQTVVSMDTTIAGIAAVTNAQPFTNGKDPENEIARRRRFQRYVATLHYGSANSIEAALADSAVISPFGTSSERVGRVRVMEDSYPLTVYITNDVVPNVVIDGLPSASQTLIEAVGDDLNGTVVNGVKVAGYKAAGTKTKIVAATMYPVTVNLTVSAITGYSFDLLVAGIRESVNDFFNRLNIGESLTLQYLRNAITRVRGIDTFYLQSPTVDIVPDEGEIVTLVPFADFSADSPPPLGTEGMSWIQRIT